MEKYYYHGFEFYPGALNDAICKMLSILDEGLKTRNEIRDYQDSSYQHICLYKKNDSYNYHDELAFLHSARGGWIDHCFVVIIDSGIDAYQARLGIDTDLVDEWRCDEDIDPSHFVGVGLPIKTIQDYLNSFSSLEEERIDQEQARKSFCTLCEKIDSCHIPLVDSDQEFFTDEFDSSTDRIRSL